LNASALTIAASLPYLSNGDAAAFALSLVQNFWFIQKMKERSCARLFLLPTKPLTVSTSTADSVRTFRTPFVLLCPVSFIENPIKEHQKKLKNQKNPSRRSTISTATLNLTFTHLLPFDLYLFATIDLHLSGLLTELVSSINPAILDHP
jgi:hypothetical protein